MNDTPSRRDHAAITGGLSLSLPIPNPFIHDI
jgi:hypothetical protein